MPAALKRRGVLFAALAIGVVVLLFGSVQTTLALWTAQADGPASDITTGTIGLAPGSGGGSSFTFPALNGTNVVPGQPQQAVLTINNTGSAPLRFRLASAGPAVSTSGATVTVNLSGAPASTCPGTGTPLTGAFNAQNTSSPGTTFTSSWTPLAKGATTSWCIRAELVSVTGTQPATFTIGFDFTAEQTRP
ncbi:hypothetical protein [Gordonia sp. C13]|uniref:hypothetical protein n=1 Tax=Gordonia sp. C13 TaxID=2935078 RepID=UPI0012B8D161|nr:hypothetical protein [Gordonia sp. C13]MCK8616409.1 hypothetical protein [Gordonia sp. C13]